MNSKKLNLFDLFFENNFLKIILDVQNNRDNEEVKLFVPNSAESFVTQIA